MYLIAGLGNPGSKYENTRHNMGFKTVDNIASELGVDIRKSKFKGLIGEGKIGKEKVLLLKPQTYMNLSGESVREAAKLLNEDHYGLETVKERKAAEG